MEMQKGPKMKKTLESLCHECNELEYELAVLNKKNGYYQRARLNHEDIEEMIDISCKLERIKADIADFGTEYWVD